MRMIWNYDNFLLRKGERPDIDFSDVTTQHINRGNVSRIPCRCATCGHQWITTLTCIFAMKTGCIICKKRPRWDREKLQREISKRPDIDFSLALLDDLTKGSRSRITCICRVCTHKWKPILRSIFCNRTKCPKCSSKALWEYSRFIEQKPTRPDIDFSLVNLRDIVPSGNKKITCRCVKCLFVWKASLNEVFLEGSTCPCCNN